MPTPMPSVDYYAMKSKVSESKSRFLFLVSEIGNISRYFCCGCCHGASLSPACILGAKQRVYLY